MKQQLIEVKCKIPSNTDIVGRFLGLFEGRQDRITKLSEEFPKLWKMNFPFFHNNNKLSRQGDKILRKIQKMTEVKNLQKSAPTCMTLQRKCKLAFWRLETGEGRELHRRQIESGGRTGYTTEKVAPMSYFNDTSF